MARHLLAIAGQAALVLILAQSGCSEQGEGGQLAPRLAPVNAEAEVPEAAPAELSRAWQLDADELPRAAEHVVGVRLGTLRRPAHITQAPAKLHTRVPEGIRELRLWLSGALPLGPVPPACSVQATLRWGDAAAQVLDLPPGASGLSWQAVRLVASPQRRPTLLEIALQPTAACAGAPLWVAASEVVPVAAKLGEKRPNVVLVVVHGLRRDHMDCEAASQRHLPQVFARWCSRGVFFEDAHTTSAASTPALASMLTGMWPTAEDAPASGTHAAPTLAELLSREGYATFAVTGVPTEGSLWRGFDVTAELAGAPRDERRAARVVDTALAHLAELSHEPFFLTVALGDLADAPATPASYAQAVASVDKQLDRLIEHFVDTRLEGRTAFVLVADYGRRIEGESGSAPEELTRIPLLLVPPARSGQSPATLRSQALVSGVDVFATALRLAGAAVPTRSVSRDLTWALEGFGGFGHSYVVSHDGAAPLVLTETLRIVGSSDCDTVVQARQGKSASPQEVRSVRERALRLVERATPEVEHCKQ